MPLQGIIPAVVTPIDAEERFAPVQFERLLERLYRAGVRGVYVCGQTGEGVSQSISQRKQVAEVAVANSPPASATIIHVAAHSTADAIELARHAARSRATAVSSVPAIGFECYSFPEIKRYYQDLAAATSLPLLIYYYPELCPSIVTMDQVIELCRIPNVIGLKFTSFDLFMLSRLKRETSVVLNGRDEVLVAGLLMGADGGIGAIYNLIPDAFVRLYNQAKAGQWEQAQQLQWGINELIAILLRFPLFAAVKALLTWSGIDCGRCISPARALTGAEESELRRLLSDWRVGDIALPGI